MLETPTHSDRPGVESSSSRPNAQRGRRGLHGYAVFVAAWTAVLVFAGGLVTSTGSGLAVPDWPLSYGQLFPPLVGNVLYEHGHRMVATWVGFLTILLAIGLWVWEPRRWLRWLGVAALAAVVFQGVLGGLTVLFLLPTPISVAHACLGQTFFGLMVGIALFTSAGWRSSQAVVPETEGRLSLHTLAVGTTAVVYLQLGLGAFMRHTGAGLAIPDFPLAFGSLVPSLSTQGITVHYAHRVFAVLVALCVGTTVTHVFRHHRARRQLVVPAIVLLALVCVQIALGGATVLSRKAVVPTTLHVWTGALVLATSLVLTLWSYRLLAHGGVVAGARSRVIRPGFGATGRRVSDFLQLTKPRITTFVVFSTFVGFYLAVGTKIDPWILLHTLLGTALVCSGASALNQVLEKERDARMRRTSNRPLPAARLSKAEALQFGVVLSVLGLVELALFANMLAALVASATLASYLFVYTPLKARTWFCTAIGAVPGALPPVIGWAAASGTLGPGAWSLFAILYIWQLPHFYAIAWIHREDYARGGFPMLAVLDPQGVSTGRQILSWTTVLLPASLLPALLGLAGSIYSAGAIALGLGYVVLGAHFAWRCTDARARRLFHGSLVYLPALLALLVLDPISPL